MTQAYTPAPIPPEWAKQLPTHKADLQRARALIALGYPGVAPVLVNLLEWLRDGNWPVGNLLAPFLAGIGAPLAGPMRIVFQGADGWWKHCLLTDVVAHSPELARALRGELLRFAKSPSDEEEEEEVNLIAAGILAQLGP